MRLLSLLKDDRIIIEEFRIMKSELHSEKDGIIKYKREYEEIIYTSKGDDATYQEIQEVLKQIATVFKQSM